MNSRLEIKMYSDVSLDVSTVNEKNQQTAITLDTESNLGDAATLLWKETHTIIY